MRNRLRSVAVRLCAIYTRRCSRSANTQTVSHAVHVAGKAAFLGLGSHRKGLGIHIRCGLAKRQAFPASHPLAGAGGLAL